MSKQPRKTKQNHVIYKYVPMISLWFPDLYLASSKPGAGSPGCLKASKHPGKWDENQYENQVWKSGEI